MPHPEGTLKPPSGSLPGADRSRGALALEDRDAIDDRVERIARDGDAEVALRVEQREPLEGPIEVRAHLGILPGFEGLLKPRAITSSG
ncbi:MAG: hypothetical protein Q8S73_40415 [Deltaproteobacteria bacterium]|nr:hypothetical protein [Deltaproteobacteria bacterium]